MRTVPLFYGLPASRFEPAEAVELPHLTLPVRSPDAFAAVIVGDCMEPHYPDRCTVLFEPVGKAQELEVGAAYYVGQNGEGDGGVTFKLLVAVSDKTITLRCTNPKRRREKIVVERRAIARMAKATQVIRPAPKMKV